MKTALLAVLLLVGCGGAPSGLSGAPNPDSNASETPDTQVPVETGKPPSPPDSDGGTPGSEGGSPSEDSGKDSAPAEDAGNSADSGSAVDSAPSCPVGNCGIYTFEGITCTQTCSSDQGCSTFAFGGASGICGPLPVCGAGQCGSISNNYGSTDCGECPPDAGSPDASPAPVCDDPEPVYNADCGYAPPGWIACGGADSPTSTLTGCSNAGVDGVFCCPPGST
jgi:hypothetical protein